MWDDSTSWDDSTVWNDTDELDAVTVTETTITKLLAPVVSPSLANYMQKVQTLTISDQTESFSWPGLVPAGHALQSVYVAEANSIATTMKCGTSSDGDQWFGVTSIAAGAVTSIPVGKAISMTSDSDMYVTLTSTGFSLNIYFLIIKLF